MKIISDFVTNSSEADYYDCDCYDCDCYDCDCKDCNCRDCDCINCNCDCDCDDACTLDDYVSDMFGGDWEMFEANWSDD